MPSVRPTSAANGTFERHRGEVYAWAFRLVGRHHDALDVVQDVFVKWAQQCSRETPDRPRGWLRRVTINQAIDILRQRPSAVRTIVTANASGSGRATGGIEPLDRPDLHNDLADALQRLSEPQRGVLVAKVYDEMTFKQIADEMGLAVPTVKTHYMRALAAVRERLRRRWGQAT